MNSLAFVVLFAQLLAQWPTISITPERVDVKENFKVEPLKADEVKQIEEAATALSQAEQKYAQVINEVKSKYGQAPLGMGLMGCGVDVAHVQIRGQYALISTEKNYATCAVMAIGR